METNPHLVFPFLSAANFFVQTPRFFALAGALLLLREKAVDQGTLSPPGPNLSC